MSFRIQRALLVCIIPEDVCYISQQHIHTLRDKYNIASDATATSTRNMLRAKVPSQTFCVIIVLSPTCASSFCSPLHCGCLLLSLNLRRGCIQHAFLLALYVLCHSPVRVPLCSAPPCFFDNTHFLLCASISLPRSNHRLNNAPPHILIYRMNAFHAAIYPSMANRIGISVRRPRQSNGTE